MGWSCSKPVKEEVEDSKAKLVVTDAVANDNVKDAGVPVIASGTWHGFLAR